MKRSFASLLVAIFALCTVPSLSVADAAAPPIQYAEDHELTPYSFENFQDKLSIQLDEKWKQFVFFWPEDNHVEVDEHVLTSLPVVATNQQEVVLLTFHRDSNDQQWNLSSANEKERASSGCSCRRQLATDSRQPKRGFGTAVPKTTIEVAEQSP